jgi:predicted nucleotidyltransferase
MITKTQLNIFQAFSKRPFAEYTRKEIKKTLNQKSNNLLNSTINLLKKEEVLIEKKVGKSGLLTLNFKNSLTFYYLALYNSSKIKQDVKLSIELLKKEILEETSFYSIVIFGSYAINKQKKKSDLDIAIFIPNKINQKQVEALTNSAKLKSVINLDIYIIFESEMIEMLINNEENLGKQIVRKHIAIYNPTIFYEIINRGINHGFRV